MNMAEAVPAQITQDDWQVIVTERIRAVEVLYGIHDGLRNWARWGMGRNFETPFLTRPAIWSLPGEVDKDMDPEAAPTPPKIPVNEKWAKELDVVVNHEEFPALWRNIICIHYLTLRDRRGKFTTLYEPEWRRPALLDLTVDGYIGHLHMLLSFLDDRD